MIFCFNTVTANQGASQFFYQFDQLEKGLEFLNHVVMQGDKLTNVYLIEGGRRTNLSVEAFDGISFLPVLRKLEVEWKYLLTKFPRFQAIQAERICWYKEKLVYYEQHIIYLEFMIDSVSDHCERQNHFPLIRDKVVVARYESLSNRYKAQINQAYSIRDFLLSRIYDTEISCEV